MLNGYGKMSYANTGTGHGVRLRFSQGKVFVPHNVEWLWQNVIYQYWNWACSKTAFFPSNGHEASAICDACQSTLLALSGNYTHKKLHAEQHIYRHTLHVHTSSLSVPGFSSFHPYSQGMLDIVFTSFFILFRLGGLYGGRMNGIYRPELLACVYAIYKVYS